LFLAPFKENLAGFITTSVHVSSDYLLEIGKALTAFYRFLGDVSLISPDQSEQFVQKVDTNVKDFAPKLDDYYRINHDIELTDEEKNERIQLLFGI